MHTLSTYIHAYIHTYIHWPIQVYIHWSSPIQIYIQWNLFYCDYFSSWRSIRRKVVGMAVKISRVVLTGHWRTSGSTWWETRQWDKSGWRFKILYKVSYSKFNVLNIHYCCYMHTCIHKYIHTKYIFTYVQQTCMHTYIQTQTDMHSIITVILSNIHIFVLNIYCIIMNFELLRSRIWKECKGVGSWQGEGGNENVCVAQCDTHVLISWSRKE